MNKKTNLALALLLALALGAYGLLAHRSTADLSDAERAARVAGMYADYRQDFPKAAEIDAAEAVRLSQAGQALFVDVRGPQEQAVSMLPGALTRENFLKNPGQAGNRTVIAYCTIGYRSGKFVEEYTAKGGQALNLAGGMLAWLHAGGQLADAQGPTRRVHVYGRQWDLAPHAFAAIW